MNKEVIDVSNKMQLIIEALKIEGKRSQELIEAKAKSTMSYKGKRAVSSLKARADGMSVTLIKHHAEGEASTEEYQMIVDTEGLKAHWIRMENLKAQLNALQSINRHLSHI
jgi:hypothetical protein